MMSKKCLVIFFPWAAPLGVMAFTCGSILEHFGVISDFWAGYLEGLGAVLGLFGAAFLVATLVRRQKTDQK